MAKRAELLLLDDEEELRNAVGKILAKEGYRVTPFAEPTAALAAFAAQEFDLLITDLAMPEVSGMEVLKRAKELRPDVEVIMITAHGNVENAVESMRLGAFDFIEKPIDRNLLVKRVAHAVENRRLATENRRLRAELGEEQGDDALVGTSAAMTNVKKLLRQIAPTDVSVLVQGESGTGKEVVADVIHGLSPRAGRPIVKISCAAIPETLLESELFGYERGAFTGANTAKPGKFELGNGGSIFLDEIGEMSPALQAKLLRVLQDGRVQRLGSTRDIQADVRVISATNVDIQAAIADNKFREDLYYRLNVVQVCLPPLRERRDDIPLLADHFLKKYAARMQREVRGITSAALDQLLEHPWPGNVRELENAMQRALAMATGDTIENFHLIPHPGGARTAGQVAAYGPALTLAVGTPLAEVEERMVNETLKLCDGDKEKAARLLGISSRTLYRRFSRDTTRQA